MSKGFCSVIPWVESCYTKDCNKSTGEIFEIDVVIHATVSFDLSKVDHPNYRVDVHE